MALRLRSNAPAIVRDDDDALGRLRRMRGETEEETSSAVPKTEEKEETEERDPLDRLQAMREAAPQPTKDREAPAASTPAASTPAAGSPGRIRPGWSVEDIATAQESNPTPRIFSNAVDRLKQARRGAEYGTDPEAIRADLEELDAMQTATAAKLESIAEPLQRANVAAQTYGSQVKAYETKLGMLSDTIANSEDPEERRRATQEAQALDLGYQKAQRAAERYGAQANELNAQAQQLITQLQEVGAGMEPRIERYNELLSWGDRRAATLERQAEEIRNRQRSLGAGLYQMTPEQQDEYWAMGKQANDLERAAARERGNYAQHLYNTQGAEKANAYLSGAEAGNRAKAETNGFIGKVLNTAGGAALNFTSGVGSTLITMARIMELPEDALYWITGDERFNLDREPYLRNSEALQASDTFREEAERMKGNAGNLGSKIIDVSYAAGNMMGASAFAGQALGAIGNSGAIANLESIANSSPLLTSRAARYGARLGAGVLKEIVSNPGNFGVAASSAVNNYSTALANGATFEQAMSNGLQKGVLEYLSNKMFSGTPFVDAPGQQGYVTKLIEYVAGKLGKSGALAKLNASTGGKVLNWFLDKSGEGLEEVITAIGDPLIDRITYDRDADLATADELVDEYIGGVLLSLLMTGGEKILTGPEALRGNKQISDFLVNNWGMSKAEADKYAPKLRKAIRATEEANQAAAAIQRAEEADRRARGETTPAAEGAGITEAPEAANENTPPVPGAVQSAPQTVLQQKADKYAREGKLSGQDARDIMADPRAMQTLIDAGLITGREMNDSEGRRKVADAAEQYIRNVQAEEQNGPPVPGEVRNAAETAGTVQKTEAIPQAAAENRTETAESPAGRARLEAAMAVEGQNAGEMAAQVPGEANAEAAGEKVTQRTLASERQKTAEKAASLRDAGFSTAGEDATARIRSEESWDAEEKAVGKALRDLGYEPTFAVGLIENAEGKSVPYLLEGNKLAVRSDHRSRSVQEIAEKAVGQALDIDQGVRNQVMETITQARAEARAARQTTKTTAEKPTVSARAQATMESARAAGASEEDGALAGRLADIIGRDIRFFNEAGKDGAWKNGYTQNGVIYINAQAKKPVAWVVGHELTHNVEHSKIYDSLKKLAQKEMGLNWSMRVQSRLDASARIAQKLGDESVRLTDPADAEREIVADFFADRLLSDEAAIRRVCEYEPVTARNIRDYIKGLLRKLGGKETTLERALTLYNKALKDVAAKAQADAENKLRLKATPEAQKQENGLRLGGRQYSVGTASELYRTETDFTEPMPADEFREKIKAESRAESYFPKGLSEKFMKAIAGKGTFNRTKLYRGIDAAEMDFLMENKYLQSNGSYNFQNQQGQTLADEDPGYALSYATGFAPKEIADKHYKDGQPSYLVEFLNSPNLNVSKNDVQESYTYDQIGQDYITRIFEIEYDPKTQKDMVRDVTEEMRAHLPDMGKGLAETAHGRPMFFRDKTTGTIVYAVQGADGWENGKYISEKDPSMTWSYEQMDSPVFSKHAPAMLGVSGNEADLEAMEVGPDGELVPERKMQFSAEDEEYLAAVEAGDMETAQRMVDEAAKQAGYSVKAWHQTAKDFTVFSTDNPLAGKNDSETPNGIFFKTNDHDIGLEGKKQMAMAINPGRTLNFKDRNDANAWYRSHVEGYDSLSKRMESALSPIDKDLQNIEDKMFANGTTDEEYDRLDKEWNGLLERMRTEEDRYRGQLRDLLNAYFLSENRPYDSIHLGYDGHRYVEGKRENVETYIVFSNKQAKSAAPVTYDDDGNVIPLSERFNSEEPDIRYSAEDSDDEYRQAPGTEALDKLGIRLAGSKGKYHLAEQLLERDKAAKELMNATKKAEKKLKATKAEKEFAAGIAAGIYEERDIPPSMNKDTVTTLADYYAAEESFKANMLAEVRGRINAEYQDEAEELLSNVDHFKKLSMLMLNERTPDRSFRAMFGPTQGKAIFDWLIRPEQMNEAAKTRWHQEQLDKVRQFKDSKGKTRALTRAESELTMLVMEGKAAAAAVADMEKKGLDAKGIRNAAENIRNGEDAADAAWEFGLKDKERELARNYARWMDTQEKLKNADSTIIENAAEAYSKIFDEFYDGINDFLVAHGYEPIGYIKGYAPHMQPEETQSLLEKAFDKMGISLGNDKAQGLPASIAGETAYFKPNKRWDPYFLHRTGTHAEYDIEKAYQSYVGYLSDILFHTDDIMRVRNMERMIRKTYASDEIKENLDWIQEIRNSPSEERLGMLRDAGKIGKTTILSGSEVNDKLDEWEEEEFNALKEDRQYNNLVMWLSNYANILAGKQSFADRGWEYSLGRNSLNFANRLQAAFQRSLVAGSLTSALNQTAQLPMIKAELGDRWYYAALKDILTGQTRGFWKDSDFLTGKHGVDMLYTDNYDKFISALFKPSTAVDYIVSTTAVRGAFLKAIHQGQSYSEAMRTADDFGRRVMGSREKGTRPLAYESKGLFSRMIHMFQVEAANSWDHIASDLPYEIKEIARTQGKPKAARTLAALLVKALLSTFLLNRLTEETYGGTPAPFDVIGLALNFVASGQGMTTNQYLKTIIDNGLEKIGSDRFFGTEDVDAEFDVGKGLEELGYNVMNDVPLLRNLAGVLGLGDQTVPLPGAGGEFADMYDAAKDLIQNGNEGKQVENLIRATLKFGFQLFPAGRQITKTGEGVEAVIRGGSYNKKGNLQYPIDSTEDQVRAVLFGKNATNAARDHWASGGGTMSEEKTEMVTKLRGQGMTGAEAQDAARTVKSFSGDDKRDQTVAYIDTLDITDGLKDEMYFYAGYKESTLDTTPWHAKGGSSGRGKTYSPSGLRLPTPERREPTRSGLKLQSAPAAKPSSGGLKLR